MRTAIAALALMLTTSAQAVTITGDRQSGDTVINVAGPITQTDGDAFKSFASHIKGHATVILSSYGGKVDAALAMGKVVHDRGWDTSVAHNAECDSACALIWLAGTNKMISVTSKVGFHSAYQTIDGVNTVVGPANAEIGAYMARLGYSDDAIVFVTTAAPAGMYYLDAYASAISPGIRYELDGLVPCRISASRPAEKADLLAMAAGDCTQSH